MFRLIAARPSGRSASALQPLAARAMQGQHDRQLLKTGEIVGKRGFNKSASAELPRRGRSGTSAGSGPASPFDLTPAQMMLAMALKNPYVRHVRHKDHFEHERQDHSAEEDTTSRQEVAFAVQSFCKAQQHLSATERKLLAQHLTPAIYAFQDREFIAVAKAAVVLDNGEAYLWQSLSSSRKGPRTLTAKAYQEMGSGGSVFRLAGFCGDNVNLVVWEMAKVLWSSVMLGGTRSRGTLVKPCFDHPFLLSQISEARVSVRIGPYFRWAEVEDFVVRGRHTYGRNEETWSGGGFSSGSGGCAPPIPTTTSLQSVSARIHGCP